MNKFFICAYSIFLYINLETLILKYLVNVLSVNQLHSALFQTIEGHPDWACWFVIVVCIIMILFTPAKD